VSIIRTDNGRHRMARCAATGLNIGSGVSLHHRRCSGTGDTD
jgi:hypothetical protein